MEKRGLATEGIYLVPGDKVHVTRVFRPSTSSRSAARVPNLEMQSVLAPGRLSGTVPSRGPLIPKSSREEFIRAAKNSDKQMLNTAICASLQPNRDTLSYLIIHWQKVISFSDINWMPKMNVARCVAMIVMMGQRQYGDLAMEQENCRVRTRSHGASLIPFGLLDGLSNAERCHESNSRRRRKDPPPPVSFRSLIDRLPFLFHY